MQILLSQSEAGAETYFEKVAAAFAADAALEQRLVIEALPSRERRLTSAGVDFRTLPMDKFGKTFLYNWQLKRAVKKYQPDLIVTWVNRASRKCPRTDAVVVGRLGGYYDVDNYRRCHHLIVNAPDLVRHVTENGWPKTDVSMVSNFGELPAAFENPEPLPDIPQNHKVLLTLGRLHQKKAQDVIIKALAKIPGTSLLIAGTGDLADDLKTLAAESGVAERVHFLGLRKDIRGLFARADLCVFPSRFEPLGNVILEAWGCKTPVVAAASQGPSWLIQNGENGLLFEVDDVEQCASQINRLLRDSELQSRLIAKGYATFSEKFSMDVIVKEYKDLFAELLLKKHAGEIAKRPLCQLTPGLASTITAQIVDD